MVPAKVPPVTAVHGLAARSRAVHSRAARGYAPAHVSTWTGWPAGHRYRLEQWLGAGGYSQVWRARDTVLDRQVAVKLLHEHVR